MRIPGLGITRTDDGRIAVLKVDGEIPRSSFDALNEFMHQEIEPRCRSLVFDYSAAGHVSSTEIGLLAYHARRFQRMGGDLVLVRPPAPVMQMLALTRLDAVARFFSSLAEALAHVREAMEVSAAE